MSNTPDLNKTRPNPAGVAGQNIPLPQAMNLAAQKIDAGELQVAEAILKQILQKQPENPNAMHLMGIIAHRVGRTELGLEMIGKAIEKLPGNAQFHINRGEMCRILKRLDEAVAHGKKAVKLEPKSASAHSNLGIAYYDQKEYDKAEACQKKALKLQPNLIPALNNMGSIMRAKKDREAAISYYKKVLALNPNYLESINNLGALLIEENETDDAVQTLLKALKINPNYAEAHNNIGNAFMVQEDFDKAMTAYNKALQINPHYPEPMLGIARIYKEKDKLDDALMTTKRAIDLNPKKPDAYSLLGDIHLKLENYDESEEAFRQALELEPELLIGHIGLGQLLLEKGELAAAETSFEHGIEINPDEIAPYVFMAQARKVKKNDAILKKLEEEAENIDEFPETKAMSLHFALGKSYDDIGEYERAFPHFLEACRLKRSKIEYNADNHDLTCRNIRNFFTGTNINRLKGGARPSDLPIFVLGMPRSGTTLVETILASHPDVYAAGELHDILRIANQPKLGVKSEGFPISMQGLTKEDIKEMGERYLAKLRKHDKNARRITDKMPANFMALGLIHLMLPEAKIVHIMRNSADCCLSSFTKNFNNSQLHSYDLTEMARFYVNYARLMEHWRTVLPENSFYEVQYEQLVAEPEPETRRLVEYCGLAWNDACLTPHKTERNVKTASITQVRQPIYTSSVERWKRYEKYLKPLFDALGEYAPTAS